MRQSRESAAALREAQRLMLDVSVMVVLYVALAALMMLAWRLVRGRTAQLSTRIARIVVSLVIALIPTGLILRAVSSSRTWQTFGELVSRVDTKERVVALTFDDGPAHVMTEQILAVLARENVKATFFLMGSGIQSHMIQARAIAAAGHEIGNHTYSHPRMVAKTWKQIDSEISRTDSLIRSTGYSRTIHFRPPFGKKLVSLPLYLARKHRVSFTWDIEPDSYADVAATSDSIAAYTISRVKPGSIVLLHVMYPVRATSLQAVKPIIDGLRARGYRFVTVSEMLALQHQ